MKIKCEVLGMAKKRITEKATVKTKVTLPTGDEIEKEEERDVVVGRRILILIRPLYKDGDGIPKAAWLDIAKIKGDATKKLYTSRKYRSQIEVPDALAKEHGWA